MKLISKTFNNLITILNDLQIHDGTSMGEQLGISRAAVWKNINKLENFGIEVVSIKGVGYVIKEPLILLNKNKISQTAEMPKLPIEIFESINSTNAYLNTKPLKASPRICLAEQQTQGRGRFNREWHSPFGQNVYFSCLYHFNKDVSELAGLSLVVSLATVATLKNFLPQAPHIKWPNDILYNGAKLAGTLIEVQAESNSSCHVVIGIGLNVNMVHQKKDKINQSWISIREIIGEQLDRNILVGSLIKNLFHYLDKFARLGLGSFLSDWRYVDFLFEKDIHLQCGDKKYKGKGQGINANGHLMILTRDGELVAFSSGDTSILK